MNSYTPIRRKKPPENLSNYWSEENQSMERLAQLQTPEAMNTALFSALKRKDLLCNVISRHAFLPGLMLCLSRCAGLGARVEASSTIAVPTPSTVPTSRSQSLATQHAPCLCSLA